MLLRPAACLAAACSARGAAPRRGSSAVAPLTQRPRISSAPQPNQQQQQRACVARAGFDANAAKSLQEAAALDELIDLMLSAKSQQEVRGKRRGRRRGDGRSSGSGGQRAPAAAAAADAPAAVTLLLRTARAALRSSDLALEALVAAAGAGSCAALEAVLGGEELQELAKMRGPRAPAMLAAALADGMRAALASGAAPCFHRLLRAAGEGESGSPAAAARAALAPHMGALFADAAGRGARGALQALLVCLPEHCDALDARALDAARAAGQADAAAEIELLLALRLQAGGGGADGCARDVAAKAAQCAAAPAPAPLCGGGGGGGGSAASSPDVRVVIDQCWGDRAAAPRSSLAAATRCGPACCGGRGASLVSVGSSSAGSDCSCGTAGAGAGAADCSVAMAADCGQQYANRSAGRCADGWPRHPYMQPCAAVTAAPPAAPASPRAPAGGGRAPPPPAAPACGLREALRAAVAADDVARAAALLTELVEAPAARLGGSANRGRGPSAAAAAAAADEGPLDAFILHLVTISAAAGTCDCAHLLASAVGSNDDAELKTAAAEALCIAAAASGRCGLLRLSAAHHRWLRAALAADGGALARRAIRAAVLRGHPHTAVWLARGLADQGLVAPTVEALLSTPPEALRGELSSLDRALAVAGSCCGAEAEAPAAPDAPSLVAAFAEAWAAAECGST
ncbi:hypothetical protein Rsub_00379 [Raphidocelis subcapitata]|uniref:Uncharacterized protein n=1 Tax=Raphidocelis subcapitata TaxID=307507 RepID=A0A2V0NK66_9CHLO|nr:hypothetical protein Rsub_00379 [Raphidocelis subcapitata]|eukprot:GBF87668.1 hypothetical protein Rsub_00379 [Raphidocelis subcapitata]